MMGRPAPPHSGGRHRILKLVPLLAAVLVATGLLATAAGWRVPRLAAPAQDDLPIVGPPPPMPEEAYLPEPPGLRVEVVATGLEVVWGLEFAPDGRLFVTERPGRVRILRPDGRLEPTPWKTLEQVHHQGEGGLMGLALHPEFPVEPWVYVMYTTRRGGDTVNRVSRIREVDGRGGPEEILLDDLPGRRNHNGGRIRFGPDGMLYVGTGDAGRRHLSQRLDVPAGSILRLTPEGEVPPDNPWPGNPAWAYGFRNVQGLAWHLRTGALFAADHGPTGEWRGARLVDRDEINIVEPGKDYGWPLAVGAPGEPGLEDPLLMWIPSAPPGDLIFYGGDAMPELRGDLFFSTLRSETLMRIRFQDPSDPHRVTATERWFNTAPRGDAVYGRLRGMTVGPDGALYVGTSNRGRGRPRQGDDRILRIVPDR